jgi:transglutaminase-like putative cysteine protease
LQPVELPDTQLGEISQYAMSFVERNKHDLMETLFAINLALHRELKYSPGSTTLRTTPYDVFILKKGVCQDFANLFVCMARLLGIPARYACGYLYVGEDDKDTIACCSSHAWVELYIPHFGWKGFDPTNGTLSHLDHVRLAYGRHYFDATPTSGTYYCRANETMDVSVKVRDLSAQTETLTDAEAAALAEETPDSPEKTEEFAEAAAV